MTVEPMLNLLAAAGIADSPEEIDGFLMLFSLPLYVVFFVASLTIACILGARFKRVITADHPIRFWSLVNLIVFLGASSMLTIASAIVSVVYGMRLLSI